MRFLAKAILALHPPTQYPVISMRLLHPGGWVGTGYWLLVTRFGGEFIDTHAALCYKDPPCGAVAQLGERLNGIQEVDGSIPFGSTKQDKELSRSS